MSSIVIVYTHNAVHDHEVVAFPDLFDRIVPRFDVDRANKVCYLQQWAVDPCHVGNHANALGISDGLMGLWNPNDVIKKWSGGVSKFGMQMVPCS